MLISRNNLQGLYYLLVCTRGKIGPQKHACVVTFVYCCFETIYKFPMNRSVRLVILCRYWLLSLKSYESVTVFIKCSLLLFLFFSLSTTIMFYITSYCNLDWCHLPFPCVSLTHHFTSDRFPAINNLIQRINLRKRRDSLILGGVIGVCTIILLLYAFHWWTGTLTDFLGVFWRSVASLEERARWELDH